MHIKDTLNKLSQLLGLCLFILALVIIHYKLKQYHLHDIITQIKQFSPNSLLLAVTFTILDYLILTLNDVLGLRYINHPIKYSKLALASFVSYVYSYNLTILGGGTARYRIYSALGVSTPKVARLIIFCSVTFWLGFLLLAGSVFLTTPHIQNTLHIPLGSIRPVGWMFVGTVIIYILFVSLRKQPLHFRSWNIALPSVSISLGQIVISSIDWLFACGVLYSLLPPEISITLRQFLAVFMLAQLVGLISYVPGGLGVFETVILLLMSPYIKSSTLVGCLLLYRLIYYILPFGAATFILAIYELTEKKRVMIKVGAAFEKWAPVIMPYVLAFMCFIAGSILLFSGALPSVKGRMEFLYDLLPLPAIEISHFLASVVGAFLLLLARGLQRRISLAYHLAVTLLVFGILFSLLKGFDYEEAIILTIVLLIFLPSRREFYRKASLLTGHLTLAWGVLVAIVIFCSVWLGFFCYKHVDYSNKLWWRFVINGDAPRFLRATSGAVIVILIYALARLLHPVKHTAEEYEISYTPETIEKIIESSRRTYPKLALLGDKKFLLNEEKNTFIMYAVEGKSCIAMGDPVGPENFWEDLLWKFRRMCRRNELWPAFYEIDSSRLDLYLDMGMSILKLGEEGRINLNDFSLEGAKNKDLRYVRNKIQKQNFVFDIISTDHLMNVIKQLKDISYIWLSEKKTREKGFSLGFFETNYISKFPIAVVRKNGKIVAFANIWQSAEKEEISIDLMRHLPDCPNGIMDYLFVELILWGKQTGYQWFNLGMAPLSGMEDDELAPLWHKLGTFIFTHGEHFYNFRGVRHYKEKFSPLWKPKYLACPKGLMLPRILTNLSSLISGGIKGTFSK
jgi:phosphatidylglycerol lysyltransferase